MKRRGPEKNAASLDKWENGNETAFTHDHISSTRLRSDFSSDKVGASNIAFQCSRGRLEMQQVGVDTNHLRAQPRCSVYIDELTSSVRRPGMSTWCQQPPQGVSRRPERFIAHL
jgi:hypothetical protein